MKKKKKEKYPTGNIIKDFPSYPNNYKDHRKFIYTIGKSKERKLNSNVWKVVWSVVEWRNVIPPRVVNLWSFPTKEDAENFMKKNDLVIPSKQN